MIRSFKLAFIATIVAVGVASPTLAQSFNPRDGTGNVLPLQFQADGGRNYWTAAEPNVQVAARKGSSVQVAARPSGAVRIAARHGKAVQVAADRVARHGA